MAQTKFSSPPDLELDLISYICKKVNGIGEITAHGIARFLETAEAFALCTEADLLEPRTQRGRSYLTPQQAHELIQIRDRFLSPGKTDIRELWIKALIRDFVENALDEINDTDFDKLLINPFLIRAFNFTDHREVIRFCFYQKVTRSIVTSWGFVVQDMLIVTGSIPSTQRGFDLRVDRDGKEYQIQIKSSPNTMNKDAVDTLNDNIARLQQAHDKIGILGVTYGLQTQLSGIMQRVSGKVLMGQDLWDFVADEKGYTQKVLEWASAGMPNNTDFGTLLDNKERAIMYDWESKYGTGRASIEKVLKRCL
ncbi:MAG TPA: PmeII family type II restriction endonuclease [Chthonomonadaceae bacterium]|nr:PmeII family type II restriction endonuclease [Chthonomonadaceae bacterium]